jgi:hypothetical protein
VKRRAGSRDRQETRRERRGKRVAMRLPTAFGLLAAVLLLTVSAPPPAVAENDDVLRYPRGFQAPGAGSAGGAGQQMRRQQTVRPGPGAPYGYAAPYGAPPQRAYAPNVFYGRVDPYYDPRRDPRAAPRPAPERPVVRRRPPPAAAPAVAQPVPAEPRKQEAKVEVTTRIAVFGDALADLVADGLGDAFGDAPEIEILSDARSGAGLVRTEGQDWPKIIRDTLAGNEATAIGLVLMGVGDRQAIREGDQSHEPLSERWRQLYAERIDAATAAFVERKVPFVWIGAPPVRGERQSADLIAMNEIVRERVERAGGVYVDIWPGFVDDENRYTQNGPDHRGQTARLRASDGVAFTRAGARTAAEFAVNEIRRIVDRRRSGAPAVARLPDEADPGAREAAIERLIDGAVQGLPPAGGAAGLPPPRPLAGPVVPLTRPEVTPGGVLLVSRPALEGDTGALNRRALEQGVAPPPRPGRADDFRWPRP